MPTGRVSLGALRRISPQAAAILDRYVADQALWVPATAFRHFFHTLCWGTFTDLDLHLLDGVVDPADRRALVEELQRYHAYLRRQRECVARFHHAYQDTLDARERELPAEYVERLRHWRERFGTLVYGRITGLTTGSGLQRFLADPAGQMAAFERAFAEYAQQQQAYWRNGADSGWPTGAQGDNPAGMSAQVEQALRILEVSADASLIEIRRAYRRRAKQLHPDWQGEQYAAQMVALNAAYQLVCTHHRAAVAAARRSERAT